MFFGRWEFWGDRHSTPLNPAWFGIVNGLWLAAVWIIAGSAMGSDDLAISAGTAFVVYAILTAMQAGRTMPRWPAGLSFAARRRAAWAVRRGEVVDDPVAAAGVVAAAASVHRDHPSLPRARAALGFFAVLSLALVALAIAYGSALGIAASLLGLATLVLTIVRLPGALRRQRDNATAALAGARRLLGEPAA
ncbi:MAG: hypothetical protein QOH83_2740 [Solirubrobacteraceae bacterium]|nr:hypothetical protein [Solirubrobacteraceae bacterium]